MKESMSERATRYMEKAADLENEVKKLQDRLQISPYGDDKIDELEQAIEFIRFDKEQLQTKYDTLNDFEQTQCAKLLAKNGIMREALKQARAALIKARTYDQFTSSDAVKDVGMAIALIAEAIDKIGVRDDV